MTIVSKKEIKYLQSINFFWLSKLWLLSQFYWGDDRTIDEKSIFLLIQKIHQKKLPDFYQDFCLLSELQILLMMSEKEGSSVTNDFLVAKLLYNY